MVCSIIKIAQKLISIPSISPQDLGCQDIMIDFLKNIGFKIKKININNTKNFWATRGVGKTLTFAGHTDVVPPGDYKDWKNHPFDPVIHNDFLFGRGSSDMKGALACMMIATKNFIKKFPTHKGRLSFLITSDEESSAIDGTKKVIDYLISEQEKIDYCIIGEPSSSSEIGDVIKNGRRGSITANLTIHGVQGHIAYPHLADNPIHKGLPIISQIMSMKLDNGNSFFPPTSLNIANIHAGDGNNNIIPNSLFVQFNFRFNTETSDQEIKSNLTKILNNNNVHYSLKWFLSGHPFVTKKGLLINTVIKSIMNLNKFQPILSTDGGTSDGRFISLMNPEIVELGLTNTTIHKSNEHVRISHLKKLTMIYEDIMEVLLT